MSAVVGEIRAETIIKELGEVWKELGKADSEYAVLRACSKTLFVATTGEQDVQELSGILGDLMHSHPSRYIVLRIVDRPEPAFSTRVFAQCQLAFGRRQQICCEQIEFLVTRDRIADFAAVSLGLTVPDLPVLLWIKDTSLLFDPDFAQVLPLARNLVIDSSQAGSASQILDELVSRRKAGWRIKDLSWTRLTHWRETVAKTFEGRMPNECLKSIRSVEVIGKPASCGSDVNYFAAWIAARLPKAEVTATGRFVERVRFSTKSTVIEIATTPEGLLEVAMDGKITKVPGPECSVSELLEEELSILGPDPVYEATLPAAAERAARTA